MKNSTSEYLAREIRECTTNLRGPLSDAVGNSLNAALELLSTLTSGVGQVTGAVIDEAARVRDKLRDAAAR